MEQQILASIIPLSLDDREAFITAKRNLLLVMSKKVQFKDEILKLIYSVIVAFFKQTQSFPDTDMFLEILQDNGVEEEKLAKAAIKFDLLVKEVVPEDKFKFYLDRSVVESSKKTFQEALVQALDTLNGPDDLENNQTSLDKAKKIITPTVFDSTMLAEEAPHGDITKDKDELLAEYNEAKLHGLENVGVATGISKIDAAVDLMLPGELIIVAGGSGEGKSWLAANIAWHASVRQKKNVLVFTAETQRIQYRRRIVTRHSNEVKFGHPLEYTKIKDGTLSEEEEEVYEMVVNDFTSGEYGGLDVAQVTNGSTLTDLRLYAENLNLWMPLDLIIVDYLTLLKPTKGRSSQREEAVELMKEAKQFAVTFNGGRGIPVLSLHQISFQERAKAKWQKGKCYTLGSLADSSEAGKSADKAYALYRSEEFEESHELGVQILKVRDAYPEDKMFKTFEDYSHAYISDLEE